MLKKIKNLVFIFLFRIFSAQEDCVFNNDYKGLSEEAIIISTKI